MPGDPRQSVDEVMAQARLQFIEAARSSLGSFEQLVTGFAETPDGNDLLTTMQRELHRLHGSAATFGFARVGRMAAALESAIKKWLADADLDRDRRAAIVSRFTQSLRQQLADETAGAPAHSGRRLWIVGLRDAVAVPLTTEASTRGFQVERVGADEVDEALEDGRPDGVITAAAALAMHTLDDVPIVTVDAGSADPQAILDAIEASIAAATPAPVGSVLVVDDDPVMRTLVQVGCSLAHLEVIVTADATSFRQALRSSQPTVIVIDIEVGDVNGLDLVRATRAYGPTAKTPVLVLSGHADDDTRAAARAAGAIDYLMKPVSLPVLTAKLAAWGTRGEIESQPAQPT